MMYFSRIRLKSTIHRSTQLSKVVSQNACGLHRLFWDLFTEDRQRNFLFREEIASEQLQSRAGIRGEPIYYVVSGNQPITNHPLFHIDTKPYQPKLQVGDHLFFELRANPVVSRKGKKHDIVMDSQRYFLLSLCEALCLHPQSDKKSMLKRELLMHGGEALDKRLNSLLKSDDAYAERLEHCAQTRDKLEWAIKTKTDLALEAWMLARKKQHGFTLCSNAFNQHKLQNSAYRWNPLSKKSRAHQKSGFSSVDFTGELKITDVDLFNKTLFEGVGRSKAFGCGLLLVRRA